MDKRQRAALFRERMLHAMRRAGLSRSALARAIASDRSTVSQLLSPDTARLPNAHLAAEAASALGVSADWLLGLSDMPERPGALLAAAVEVSDAERSAVDRKIIDWYVETAGAKIRHVPASTPEIFKTEALLAWEYASFLGRTPDQAIAQMRARLDWLRSENSDHEIAMPAHELSALAEGAGYYATCPRAVRRGQLERLAQLTEELYPRLRIFLFDARHAFSAPVTVFGSRVAVVYVGRFYLAFRDRDRVRAITEHFDALIRAATVDARDMPAQLAALTRKVG